MLSIVCHALNNAGNRTDVFLNDVVLSRRVADVLQYFVQIVLKCNAYKQTSRFCTILHTFLYLYKRSFVLRRLFDDAY